MLCGKMHCHNAKSICCTTNLVIFDKFTAINILKHAFLTECFGGTYVQWTVLQISRIQHISLVLTSDFDIHASFDLRHPVLFHWVFWNFISRAYCGSLVKIKLTVSVFIPRSYISQTVNQQLFLTILVTFPTFESFLNVIRCPYLSPVMSSFPTRNFLTHTRT